jgi:excisionase family DNA binding protein
MDVMNTELLTLEEIAKALRLSIETPRRWCRSGKLKSVRAGKAYRVPRAALDEFLQLPKNTGGRPPKQKVSGTSQRQRPKK